MHKYDFNFATWSDFVKHANYDEAQMKEEVLKATGYSRTVMAGRDIRPDFQKVNSWQEVLDLSIKGWKKGLKDTTELSARVERRLVSHIEKEDLHYDVSGEVLDIGRYCSGEPEHWGHWNTTIQEGKGQKLIHLVCNGTASAMVSAEVLIRRGAMVAAFVNMMELAGYRVKVTLAYAAGDVCAQSTIKVALKEFDQSFDQDMLGFALAHPATFRCLGFCVWDTAKDRAVQEMLGGCYGYPTDLPESDRGDVYLGRMFGNERDWQSPENAEAWVIKKLQQYGVLSGDIPKAA